MCDAEKDWHEGSFRASGVTNDCQKSPLDKPKMTFSFFICKPPVTSFYRPIWYFWPVTQYYFVCLNITLVFSSSAAQIWVKDSVECGNVPLIMTKLCSAAYFTSTTHYSSLNFTNVEDRLLLHNIAKNQLDIFWYSSVSELQSFPTLAARLPGFTAVKWSYLKPLLLLL